MAMLFLCSCENDAEAVKSLSVDDEEFPLEVQYNLTLNYSDSANKRVELYALVAENYSQLEEPKMRFPKGIEVQFFDMLGNETSRMRANDATHYSKKKFWEAYGDVVVVNSKGEQLNTEQLFWDEKEHRIYSEEFTKLSSPDKIIMGEGFESDEDFENPVITKVTGEIYLKDE
jgi:LPS export ABC transporter protein LptC